MWPFKVSEIVRDERAGLAVDRGLQDKGSATVVEQCWCYAFRRFAIRAETTLAIDTVAIPISPEPITFPGR